SAPTRSTQGLARQVIAPARHLTNDACRQVLVDPFRQLDEHAAQPISNKVNIVLPYGCPHDARAFWQHISDQLTFLDESTRQILRVDDRENARTPASCDETLDASGGRGELGPRVSELSRRNLGLDAIIEAFRGKSRLELGNPRLQDLDFRCQGR